MTPLGRGHWPRTKWGPRDFTRPIAIWMQNRANVGGGSSSAWLPMGLLAHGAKAVDEHHAELS